MHAVDMIMYLKLDYTALCVHGDLQTCPGGLVHTCISIEVPICPCKQVHVISFWYLQLVTVHVWHGRWGVQTVLYFQIENENLE